MKGNASRWISSGLESGAKKGIEAMLSQGGSVVGDALGGLVNSLVSGKQNESLSTVDLTVNTLTKIKLEGETPLTGWGGISSLPVPGSTSNPHNSPLYNVPLGVWNLQETPRVKVDIYNADTWLPFGSYVQYRYRIDPYPTIILNPQIANQFTIKNSKARLIVSGILKDRIDIVDVSPCGFGYSSGSDMVKSAVITDRWAYAPPQDYKDHIFVRISFDLVDKSNQANIYSFSRHFSVKTEDGIRYNRKDTYPKEMSPFPL